MDKVIIKNDKVTKNLGSPLGKSYPKNFRIIESTKKHTINVKKNIAEAMPIQYITNHILYKISAVKIYVNFIKLIIK